ncbi:uncharacterized protein N7515_001251 [Penicillium bovifimosum]|uniref:Uncharacterized protein n=1 Tax=Penicillium bovifimosum TaxID=126998 RepID=A0A9W9H9C3_9EURO|nr:uncharacterized protein N7515_001251 [Penicillium bovifimosum]KAJ5142464.1 hypothetical protein N7515_001251 [Penicillium bovifimosum]
MSTTRENPDPVSPNDEPIEEDIVSPCADMTREQLVQDSPMKIDLTHISPKWWGVKHVTATSKELHLNTYMVEQIKGICILGLYDAELLYVFQEQFEGWTEQMFKRVHHTYLRAMKKVLREGGINTGPITRPIPPPIRCPSSARGSRGNAGVQRKLLAEDRHQPSV